jgi:hypothetical protein
MAWSARRPSDAAASSPDPWGVRVLPGVLAAGLLGFVVNLPSRLPCRRSRVRVPSSASRNPLETAGFVLHRGRRPRHAPTLDSEWLGSREGLATRPRARMSSRCRLGRRRSSGASDFEAALIASVRSGEPVTRRASPDSVDGARQRIYTLCSVVSASLRCRLPGSRRGWSGRRTWLDIPMLMPQPSRPAVRALFGSRRTRGTGQYAGIVGKGRDGHAGLGNPWYARYEGFLTRP